ncbi:MAG: hypothetical protein DRR06_14510, partial [Gammaproteobacteria bacterium]
MIDLEKKVIDLTPEFIRGMYKKLSNNLRPGRMKADARTYIMRSNKKIAKQLDVIPGQRQQVLAKA